MSENIVDLGTDVEPFYLKIKKPWPRLRDPIRYLRAELGHELCRQFPAAYGVRIQCPVEDEDCDEHTATFTKRGECNGVAIHCEEGHTSREVIEAIVELL